MTAKSDKSKKKYHWSEGLIRSIQNPKLIILEDDVTVAIKDLYPKATFHYLVCPKQNIPSINDVTVEHLSLLKHMQEMGEKLADKHKENKFLFGYHAVPSMVRLHLHVISDDFNSPCLKNKKHWNSFTTEFFMPSKMVIEELEKTGKIKKMSSSKSKSLIDKPLKCHKCNFKPKHMVDLKKHLKSHLK